MGDDARRQAHVRRGDRAARARRGDARRDLRQPDLPAALERGRRLAGVHARSRSCSSSTRRATTTCSCSTRRRRATRSTSSTRPGRLTGFFQGRAIRMFLRPAGIGGKIIGRGTGVVFSLLKRVTGVDLLEDLSVFFRSLGGLIDGFTERAERVGALLEDPATTFLIVTSPQHDPVEEAIFFHRKLREAGMPFGGMVVNRVHAAPETNGEVPAELVDELGEALAERVADSAHDQAALAARDHAAIDHLETELQLARRRSASPSSRTTCTTSTGSHRCEPICSRRTRRRSAPPAARRWRGCRRRACAARGRGGRRGRRGGSPAGASRAPRRGPPARVGAPARRSRRARARRVSRRRRTSASRSSGAAQIAASRSHMRSSRPGRRAARAPTAASPRAPPTATSARSRARTGAAPTPARRRAGCGGRSGRRTRAAGPPPRARAGSRRSIAAQAGGERDRHPRAAVGARPGDRGERRLGVVPQPQRGLQPAQAAAGLLERRRLAGRGLEVQDGDRRVVVAVQVGRGC